MQINYLWTVYCRYTSPYRTKKREADEGTPLRAPKIRVHRNSQPEKNYFFEHIKKLINFLQWFEFAQSEIPPCLSVNDTARR